MKLYVGNISSQVKEQELQTLFETVGTVNSAKIITDAYSGQPRGFGFVEMGSREEGEKAIQTLNGHDLGGKAIIVNEARPPKRGPGGGGGGGGGKRPPRSYR